ncbi:hypothetical protein COOONC_16042 [Cooperia oncophora]
MVDVFDHYTSICTDHASGPCQIRLSEILKLNAFKREACLRLSHKTTPLHEIRLKWISVSLRCEPETLYFTRDTAYRIVDSKRCPHMGSCVGDKCGSINASSLIPELEKGNKFPGNTACVESCGGPGCDCFSLSSGCLFYRIYVEPLNSVVYEIFHCNRWTETAKILITHVDRTRDKTSTTTTVMTPNIPKKLNSFSITLSALSLPPLPLLNTQFITDSRRVAMWRTTAKPALQCWNFTSAQNLQCPVSENCVCQPAETRANCRCKDLPVGLLFNDLKNQLPATFPSLTFHHQGGSVIARVSQMVMSEFVMNFEDIFEQSILIDDAICKVKDTELIGCYNCAKGAFAEIECTSSRDNVQAEVTCGEIGFSIPCNSTGSVSTIRFSFSRAQIHLACSVSCGKVPDTFDLRGVLKFTGSIQEIVEQWLTGTPTSSAAIPWPDFYHIATVFLQWYKTALVAILGLLIILGLTYMILTTYGLRIALWMCLLAPRMVIAVIRAVCKCFREHQNHKGHTKQQ